MKAFLKAERQAYLRAVEVRANAERLLPLNRASGRFATVFAAGSLAIKYQIFPWNRDDLLSAILACQLDGLRRSQAHARQADTSVSGLRRKLVRYFKDHRPEFLNLDKKRPHLGAHKFGSAPGYLATFKGKKWIYLTSDRLKAIIGTGNAVDQLKQQLSSEGLLARKSNGKYAVQRPIFAGAKGTKGHKWVYAFRLRILREADAN